jgi:hypothetical protein
MHVTETNLGYLLETPKLILLFGGVKANLTNLQASYPTVDFMRIKQTHGDGIIETPPLEKDFQVEADAHFTSKAQTAVCISTADCVPVFLYDSRREVVAGIHAGWRGVANQIIPKTVSKLLADGSLSKDLKIFVGPHIQRKNFEVSASVRDELLSSVDLSVDNLSQFPHETFMSALSVEKSLVDLNQIVHRQLQKNQITAENIFDLHLDTFSDVRFHSHRRDKERAGRQLSFICRR